MTCEPCAAVEAFGAFCLSQTLQSREAKNEEEREKYLQELVRLQLAYETLMNDTRRRTYEKFGDFTESKKGMYWVCNRMQCVLCM